VATRSSWPTPPTRRCLPSAIGASRRITVMPKPEPIPVGWGVPPGAPDVRAPAVGVGGVRGLGAEPHAVEQCGASAGETTRLSPAQWWSNGVLYGSGRRTRAVGGSPGRACAPLEGDAQRQRAVGGLRAAHRDDGPGRGGRGAVAHGTRGRSADGTVFGGHPR
jgi:hypothetical protein